MTEVLLVRTLQAHPEKYGHVERERRYLLRQWPPGLTPQSEHSEITDRYLVRTALRLRHVYWPSTGESLWKLTQKVRSSPADGSCVLTTTLYLSEREYDLFLGLEAREVRKDRYPLVHGGRLYAVDMFHGALAGLILAETECASDEELNALTVPEFAALDVSGEEAFTGGALAALGPTEALALLERFGV